MHRLIDLKALHVKSMVLICFAGALMLGWMMMGSTTWAQTPRPTLTPAPTDIPDATATPTPAPAIEPQAPSAYSGPILRGKVLNLTTGQPESGVTVVFVAGGVSVEVVTEENGEYAFQHLGAANGVLNVVPSSDSGLKPATVDVAVQSKPGVETVVNLGVSPNGSGVPPLIPSVQTSPNVVNPGDILTITVLIKNTLPEFITGATVTNWLPGSVVPVRIHSSTGNPYFSDNLAVAEFGKLEAGDGAMVEIVVQSTGGRTATLALQGKASFYFRENAAAQASGTSAGSAPTVLPVTGVGLPVIGLSLIIIVVLAGWIRRRMGRRLPAG